MRKLLICIGLTVGIVSSAQASHVFNTDVPFATRGECEARRAELSNDDDFLIEAFPEYFSSEGEVRSFLNRAFTCELRPDGNWYITDHRLEVIGSDWFQRRL